MVYRMPDDLCDQPLVVVTYRGAVVLNGPGNVALAMTADAAEKSGKSLLKAAQRARQRQAHQSTLTKLSQIRAPLSRTK